MKALNNSPALSRVGGSELLQVCVCLSHVIENFHHITGNVNFQFTISFDKGMLLQQRGKNFKLAKDVLITVSLIIFQMKNIINIIFLLNFGTVIANFGAL